jgi:hypothetical protein
MQKLKTQTCAQQKLPRRVRSRNYSGEIEMLEMG